MTPVAEAQNQFLPVAPTTSRSQALSLLKCQDASQLAKLPIDVIVRIFSLLCLKDLLSVSLTCKGIHAISQDNHLWRNLFNNRFSPPIPAGTLKEEGACLREYKNRHRSHSNLTNGVYASRRLELRNPGNFLCVDGNLISAYIKIQILDLRSEKVIRSFGYTRKFYNLIWVNGNLISYHQDGAIKIWDSRSDQCIRTIENCARSWLEMVILVWADGDLVLGHDDGTVRIMDLNTGQFTWTSEGHRSKVTSLIWADGKLISGHGDGSINIWDLKSLKCTKTLEGHPERVQALLWIDGILISCSFYTIKIWDLESGGCTRTLKELEGNRRYISALFLAEGKIISGHGDGSVSIWDLASGQCTKTFRGAAFDENTSGDGYGPNDFTEWIWADEKLIASDYRQTKILDFSAPDSMIFKEIAELFRSKYTVIEAMERFSRMPKKAREKIYFELKQILWSFDWGIEVAKNAFHDQWGLSSTPEQKAQAIENYLNRSDKLEEIEPITQDRSSLATSVQSPAAALCLTAGVLSLLALFTFHKMR